jgi:hypothetical protein
LRGLPLFYFPSSWLTTSPQHLPWWNCRSQILFSSTLQSTTNIQVNPTLPPPSRVSFQSWRKRLSVPTWIPISDDKPSDHSFVPPSHSFIVEESPVDIRYYIHSAILFFYLLWWTPIPRLVTILGFTVYNFFAPMVRIRYPTFGRLGILDDLRINAGATLSLFASITALFLQVSPKPYSVPN